MKSSFAAFISWGAGAFSSSDKSGSGVKNGSAGVKAKNPSVAGTSSTASNSDTDDEEDVTEGLESSSDSFDLLDEIAEEAPDFISDSFEESVCSKVTFESMFPGTEEQYGFNFKEASEADLEKYERFVTFGQSALPWYKGCTNLMKNIQQGQASLFCPSDIKLHDYHKDLLPMPSAKDQAIYQRYVNVGHFLTIFKFDINADFCFRLESLVSSTPQRKKIWTSTSTT